MMAPTRWVGAGQAGPGPWAAAAVVASAAAAVAASAACSLGPGWGGALGKARLRKGPPGAGGWGGVMGRPAGPSERETFYHNECVSKDRDQSRSGQRGSLLS